MVKVIQADNERGLRNVIDGEAELLTGFEFNIRGKLEPACLLHIQTLTELELYPLVSIHLFLQI
jgi:hypothetical protein